MKYKSELIKEIVATRGHKKSSLHYESECVEKWIEETKETYPKLCDYQSEWLNYINENPLGKIPYETVTDVTDATVNNVVPYDYKTAILKGQTLVNRITSQGFGGNSRLYESQLNDQPFNSGDIFTVFVVNPNVTSVVIGLNSSVDNSWIGEKRHDVPSNKKITVTVQPGAICKYMGVNVPVSNDSTGFENSLVAVEGDQTHLNVDTYFEGMQSVRMPTLTTSNGDGTKTNILTVNEDVTLRSNGNVYDELDLLTGKLTQRIDEDGSVLTQEVVKTVDLSIQDQDGNTLREIKPIEGTMHIHSDGTPLKPSITMEIPVEEE